MLWPPLFSALQRDYIFWSVIILALAAACFLTYRAISRRQRLWYRFARQHGFRYENQTQPEVFGRIDNRTFRLSISDESSDHGLFGIQEEAMTLGVETGVEHEFQLTNGGSYMAALREATGEDEITHIEAEGFDSRTCLETADPDRLRMYLDEPRRAAMLRLIDACPGCDVRLTQSELSIRERTSGKSKHELNTRLATLRNAASVFDGG